MIIIIGNKKFPPLSPSPHSLCHPSLYYRIVVSMEDEVYFPGHCIRLGGFFFPPVLFSFFLSSSFLMDHSRSFQCRNYFMIADEIKIFSPPSSLFPFLAPPPTVVQYYGVYCSSSSEDIKIVKVIGTVSAGILPFFPSPFPFPFFPVLFPTMQKNSLHHRYEK